MFRTILRLAVCLTSVEAVLATEPIVLNRPSTSSNEHVQLNDVAGWLERLSPEAQRGYRHLTESVYLPADLDEQVARELEQMLAAKGVASSNSRAIQADATQTQPSNSASPQLDAELRSRLLAHYGLTSRPGDEAARDPLQYVVTEKGEWVMNCFACHGGSVYGTTMPGAPNNAYQLQTLVEDIRTAKLRLSKPLGHMEIGSIFMPLGTTAGTTNAVMFGVALMAFRDEDLNVLSLRPGPKLVNHDMDAPAWWLMHRKTRIYADGFAQKGHRGLMQFMLVRENGPDKFRAWESDFRDVYAFIEALRPPAYPEPVNEELAEVGRVAFNDHCSRCHGTYGPNSIYPELLIPIEEIATDRVRLDSLSLQHRAAYGKSWFATYDGQVTWDDPQGYMAPPLDGIWASAPYLHNGSVPTLWHLLNPELRPKLWRRTAIELDRERVGLTVEELESVPSNVRANVERRKYFDTSRYGKSSSGHDFPLELNVDQRKAVLEYLKTL